MQVTLMIGSLICLHCGLGIENGEDGDKCLRHPVIAYSFHYLPFEYLAIVLPAL